MPKQKRIMWLNYSLVIGLIAFTLGVDAKDTRMTLANNMIATQHTPDTEVKAVVLMIHGWTGNMDEVGDLYKTTAQELASQGIASLRINIRGESEREKTNYTLTSTFASRVEDAQTGLEYLRKTYPNLPKGVLGFSLGGSTAIALAGNNPEQIDSMVLWSSAGNPDAVGANALNAEQRRTVLESGKVTLNSWETITVTKEHYLGMQGYDIFTPLSAYTGALLCIRGTNDSIADIDRIIIDAASGSVEEYRHIAGADHIFNVLDPNSQYDQRLIQQTLDWFVDTLVL